MNSPFNQHKCIVKTYWSEVREAVAKVEPKFSEIVDNLDPDQSFPLFLAYYPYGSTDADTISSLFPRDDGSFFRISDNDAPKDIIKHLGYSINNTPLGMVLEKEIECFIDLKRDDVTIPWHIYQPGSLFPFARILNKISDRVYAPNGLLSSTAGARSTFMLPNIGCGTNHSNLQRDFNVQSPPPKSLYEHWNIFKEIANSNIIDSNWRCCVMYFSENWLTHIHENISWNPLKQYLHELAWYRYEWDRNRIYYDITFSMIQKKRNLKPNPYLADTAMHLYATALGAAPGYSPSLDDQALPLDVLQKAYIESYGLKKYQPTIIQPRHWRFETEKHPIYYSLQHPSTHVSSPKSRDSSSTLSDLRELDHIMRIYKQELTTKDALCTDTVLSKVAEHVSFKYYHNKADSHRIADNSLLMFNYDSRFNTINETYRQKHATYASDAPFVRGCVSIFKADTEQHDSGHEE